MKRPVILCPVPAGHPGRHGVHVQLTAVDSQETNQDLGRASPDHVQEIKLSNKFALQRRVQLGMNGPSGPTVTLSATRVTAPGLELAQFLESAMAQPKKPKLVLMEPAPNGASGVISDNAALNAAMVPNREKDNASGLEPVTVTQSNVKSAAMHNHVTRVWCSGSESGVGGITRGESSHENATLPFLFHHQALESF